MIRVCEFKEPLVISAMLPSGSCPCEVASSRVRTERSAAPLLPFGLTCLSLSFAHQYYPLLPGAQVNSSIQSPLSVSSFTATHSSRRSGTGEEQRRKSERETEATSDHLPQQVKPCSRGYRCMCVHLRRRSCSCSRCITGRLILSFLSEKSFLAEEPAAMTEIRLPFQLLILSFSLSLLRFRTNTKADTTRRSRERKETPLACDFTAAERLTRLACNRCMSV